MRKLALKLLRKVLNKTSLRFNLHKRFVAAGQIWIVDEAASYLERVCDLQTLNVLEFGAGASTVWFCRRAKRINTVEASAQWASLVLSVLAKDYPQSLPKLALKFVNAEFNCDLEFNKWYVSDSLLNCEDGNLLDLANRYAEIDEKEDFDLIFIDGSVRAFCLREAVRYLNGRKNREPDAQLWLVVDNSEKPWRADYIDQLVPKDWERVDFINNNVDSAVEYGSQTTIWRL